MNSSNQLGYHKVIKFNITIRNRNDKTIEGITDLEDKKKRKEPGSIEFHLDDNGVVVKAISKKIIK